MNRTIKFRAFVLGKMQYDVTLNSHGHYTRPNARGLLHSTYPSAPVMQYTGLKDANNKEIYEGDLVMITDDPYIDTKGYWLSEVVYRCSADHDDSVGFKLECRVAYEEFNEEQGYHKFPLGSDSYIFPRTEQGGHGSLDDFNIYSNIVIGNIYENPELLKEENEKISND